MARRVKWYTVTSPRSQAVVLADGTAKQQARGSRFRAAETSVTHLLRSKVIRELHPREITPPAPKPEEDLYVVDEG